MERDDRRHLADEELATRARGGDVRAFGVLWERHARAGLAAARTFRSIAEPEDIVAEAYLRILRAIQHGGGPHEAFRPYLYRTIRNVALGWKPDSTPVALDDAAERPDDHPGPEELAAENTVTVRAFRTLPERWQTVLWYTEVEGMDPADAASLVGLSANATAALAYRARAGLKKAWLQAHVNELRVPPGCRWTTERMGEYVTGGLTPRGRVRFDEHLKTCAHCSILLEEIDHLGDRLAAILLPVMVGGVAGATLLAQLRSSPKQGGTAAARPRHVLTGILVAAAVVTGGAITVSALLVSQSTGTSSHSGIAPSTGARDDSPTPLADTPTTSPTTPAPGEPAPVPQRTDAVAAPPIAPPPADTTAPPAAAITAPAENALLAVALPLFTGTGEPGAVVRVELLAADGTTVLNTVASATVAGDGSWSAPTLAPIPDGPHSFRVAQTDAAGNVSTPTLLTLTIDTVALAPTIDAAAAGPLLWLPDLTGTAEPDAAIQLFDDHGASLGTTVADGTGTWSIPLPDPGRDDESVTAVQTDPAGNRSVPSPAQGPFVFQRPDLQEPTEGSTVPSTAGATIVSVQIGGVAGMEVEVFVDGVSTGNLHTLGATPIVRVTQPLPDGAHSIGVRYVDPTTGRVGSLISSQFTIG